MDWNFSYERFRDSIASTGTPLTGMLKAGKNASLFVSQAEKDKRHAAFYSANWTTKAK